MKGHSEDVARPLRNVSRVILNAFFLSIVMVLHIKILSWALIFILRITKAVHFLKRKVQARFSLWDASSRNAQSNC